MSLSLPPGLDDLEDPKVPMTGKLVLGSGSPRRRELLGQIGLEPDIIDAPNIDETPAKGEKPRLYALRMAREKAEALEPHYLGNFIITGDTVVATGARILPQAQSLAQARQCLQMLSGRSHAVYSALTLITDAGRVLHRLTKSRVTFKRLSAGEISSYLDSGEWQGKAGGYAIQGLAAGLISGLKGSYSAVVGLDLFHVQSLLTGCGFGALPTAQPPA